MGVSWSASAATAGLSSSCDCAERSDDSPADSSIPAEKPECLLKQFRIDRILGEGAFGVTYACCDSCTGEEVAVKVVEVEEMSSEAVEEEAGFMRSLLHDNIVRLRQVVLDRSFVSIVMDLYSGGDLISGIERQLKDRGKISCSDVAHVSLQMAVAVQYLHWKGIVHRDIKGDNFLMDRADIIDRKCQVALSDFGTACKLGPSERLSKQVGTRNFWAPEVFAEDYGLKVDVWALGVTMYSLLTGGYPFSGEEHVRTAAVDDPEGIDATCADYLRSLLCKEEAHRLEADQAASHTWHC